MINVRNKFDLHSTKGTYGVEVEVEGDGLPDRVDGFNKEADGSLRGESAEFVFAGPCGLKPAMNRIDNLFQAYKLNWTNLRNSYRCSVHVHANVQDFTIPQVANFVTLYAIFETYLVKYCGEHREGNLFCLRLEDAEFTIRRFLDALCENSFRHLASDNLRYSAINLKALLTYGSIEFRAMRGPDTADEIKDWVKLIDCLRTAAQEYNNPVEIVEQLSGQGPEAFAEQVFGKLLEKLPVDDNWRDVVLSNVRMVQDLAYIPDYGVYEDE